MLRPVCAARTSSVACGSCIAHHEPVHQVNLAERYTEALEVIGGVVDRRDDVPWNVHEVGRLMSTRDERDRWLADVVKASIAGGWTHLPRYQVFFLSRPGESGHVTLAEPLVNPRRGRGSAWVQRQRYVLVSDLERVSSTDQLDGGTLA